MLFTSYDNKQICVHEWKEVREPVGVVQIAHGMNEYAGRYEKFARRLNEIGYVVVADDHRGHGETDADNLGYAEGDMFTDTLKDTSVVCADKILSHCKSCAGSGLVGHCHIIFFGNIIAERIC